MCSARLHWRARIETSGCGGAAVAAYVAPAFTGGRGLKQNALDGGAVHDFVAPAFTGGRGLKQNALDGGAVHDFVAPAFTGGRGLKPRDGSNQRLLSPGERRFCIWAGS